MHPLAALLDWLPDCDFGVMEHGFIPHGRDYSFVIESSMGKDPGQHQIQFTHVTELAYSTAVPDEAWPKSWDESFIDYQSWLDAGEPDGYVWGTCWSLAWPGIQAIEPSSKAAEWAERFGHPMYEAKITTDRFSISLIFHSVRWRKISNETPTVSSVIIPLASQGS